MLFKIYDYLLFLEDFFWYSFWGTFFWIHNSHMLGLAIYLSILLFIWFYLTNYKIRSTSVRLKTSTKIDITPFGGHCVRGPGKPVLLAPNGQRPGITKLQNWYLFYDFYLNIYGKLSIIQCYSLIFSMAENRF